MINDYVGRNGKTPAEGSLLELPVFDKKTVLKIYAKDLSLFSEVLEAYFLDIPNMVQTIREAIESWNSQKLAYSAHALKGAVSVLEAKRVYQVAKQLEFIGKSKYLGKYTCCFPPIGN